MFRDVLETVSKVLGLNLSAAQISSWATNNEFFVTRGILAVEMAANTLEPMGWLTFKQFWWPRVWQAKPDPEFALDACRLAFVVHISKRLGVSGLPSAVRSLGPSGGCAFP